MKRTVRYVQRTRCWMKREKRIFEQRAQQCSKTQLIRRLIVFCVEFFRLATENAFYQHANHRSEATGRCGIRARVAVSIAGHLERRSAQAHVRTTRFGGQGQEVRHGAEHTYGIDEANTRTSTTSQYAFVQPDTKRPRIEFIFIF